MGHKLVMKTHGRYLPAVAFICSLVATPAHCSAKDPILVSMAFLDILTEVVTNKVAQKSYLDYQHQRYGLSHSERFPGSAHALVHDRPVCADGQDVQDFLNQECKLYQVVDAKLGCEPTQKNCLAFRLADFVAQDKHLMLAISQAFNKVEDVVPDPASLDRRYGARDLQTPGLILSPHGQWTVLGLDNNKPRKGLMKQLENGLFAISFS